MSTNVSNFIRITIPKALVLQESEDSTLGKSITDATIAAGGVTVTEATGSWVDSDGKWHTEKVMLYQWNFAHAQHRAVSATTRAVVEALFNLGEQAVMRERYYTWNGYNAAIIHAPTKH